MKNTLYILIVLYVLSSCGPHRMSCGAKGICENSEKQSLEKPEMVSEVKL